MASFFRSKAASTKTADSSASSIKSTDANKTHEVILVPGEGSTVTKKWEYDEHQLAQYSKTLLLPATDDYHPWEARFLADPGTHPRYMRAAKWKLSDAKTRIKGTLEWRREFKPELIGPEDVGIEAESGKIIITGFDNDARPIIYMRPGRENTETSPRQIRHLIYNLERALDLMPPGQEQVAIIVDYKSATSQSNPSIGTARKVLNILQNHYVERLGRGLVVNMPWWINAFFSGISPFMDPITRDKIRFNPKLTELVPPAQLDAEFGGDYKFEYDFKHYWKTLTEFCHISPDGTRYNDQKETIIPPSGNGIKAALEGYVPRQGAVVSGDIVKASSSGSAAAAAGGVRNAQDTAAGGHGTAVSSGAAPHGVTSEEAEVEDQTDAQKLAAEHGTSTHTGAAGEGAGAGLEKDMEKLAVETAPGEPVGREEAAFDHKSSEKEIKETLAQA
ncbi:pleiotropic drug resistance protein [Cryptococcus wingfieldii CBS 7118]|uniref:Pleiotropic drug resistance protein n=1 Tax=Cryptococcus wingfieldii CBS 7118 TaxID=1295528 RepID=A0A1E3IGQ8_9TREE|nr:pleiotropic drug resistance protein [Cryptococcus wingfieldii CBS 7118]ODN87718.1 pleiotropic drug resistance protein [Cryptococcus wingfieldii CBS 7118]